MPESDLCVEEDTKAFDEGWPALTFAFLQSQSAWSHGLHTLHERRHWPAPKSPPTIQSSLDLQSPRAAHALHLRMHVSNNDKHRTKKKHAQQSSLQSNEQADCISCRSRHLLRIEVHAEARVMLDLMGVWFVLKVISCKQHTKNKTVVFVIAGIALIPAYRPPMLTTPYTTSQ